MKQILITLTLITFIGIVACQNKSADATGTADNSPEASAQEEGQFSSIPQEMMMKVWNEVDLLDYIFHDLPFSMSQNEQASIRTNVTYIGKDAQTSIPPGCKPIARQFYQTNGDIFLEADIYFDEHCKFYVFFIDGKPAYANKMSPEGVSFFTTMIKQALNASQNIGQ